MISTSLFFSLKATPGGELDQWEVMPKPKEPVWSQGRLIYPKPEPRKIKRRPKKYASEKYWAGHRIFQQPLHDFCKRLCMEYGIKYEGYHLGTIDLSSPNVAAFQQRMLELSDVVCFQGGSVRFTLTDDEKTPCEWFVLNPKDCPDSIEDRFTESEKCRADHMPTDVHSVQYDFVSESFKQVVEEEGFTGAEFVWIRDTGKRSAPQWFRIIAQEPVGRGLDHEWFDPQTITGKDDQTINPIYRCGVTDFSREQFKVGVCLGDRVKDALLALVPNGESCLDGLKLSSYPKLLRCALPKTDFAFKWRDDGGFRLACFNRRVRDCLVGRGILSVKECDPMMVVDSAPRGVLVLDGRAPCPPPYEPMERLAHVRAEAAAAWKAFSAKGALKSATPSLEQVLGLMSKVAKKGPHKFNSGATQETIRKATKGLPLKVPNVWQKVLAKANGAQIFGVFGDLLIQSAKHLEGCQESSHERGLEHNPEFPAHLLHFALTGEGDVLSLDTSKLTTDGDCPVVLVSHETFEPERVWQSIPEFLQEVLESAVE